MIFNAVSGFGNRLLPIVSIYAWCKKNGVRMGIIWNQRTHRSGLPRDEGDRALSMQDYFESMPEELDVFANLESALNYYDINTEEVTDYDMQWSAQFDTRYLGCDHLLIRNCCYLISLDTGNESVVGQRADLTSEAQDSYAYHPYIKSIKQAIRNFVFTARTREIGDDLYQNNMTGLQLRNTDGGFTINANAEVISHMHSIIEQSECIYFSNDRYSDMKSVLDRHRNVVAYENADKFLNNELGSFLSLVDIYVLSRCEKILVASRSSFGLVAHLYSDNSKIEYWI